MSEPVLICTDLDRTLIPNGPQPESPEARVRFRRLAERPETRLAYVTGRHLGLAVEAIAGYALPPPDFLVCDVGTTVYTASSGETGSPDWELDEGWHRQIASGWSDRGREHVAGLFADVGELRLQPESKQNTFKLSYFTAEDVDVERLTAEMERRLETADIGATLIWSRDEAAGLGLLDVVPARATKRHAVEYLLLRTGCSRHNAVFAGDSGNDLQVFASGVPCVLVANASADVREEALRVGAQHGTSRSIYLARGGFLGMNGNYGAGILEGLVHFIPETSGWFD